MEVKKIVEGMTAPEVAQVIDENFNGLNAEKATVEAVADVQKNVNASDDNTGVLSYPVFDDTEPVEVGAVRRYEGLLYRSKVAGANYWDPEKWERVTLKQLEDEKLSELAQKVEIYGKVGEYSKDGFKYVTKELVEDEDFALSDMIEIPPTATTIDLITGSDEQYDDEYLVLFQGSTIAGWYPSKNSKGLSLRGAGVFNHLVLSMKKDKIPNYKVIVDGESIFEGGKLVKDIVIKQDEDIKGIKEVLFNDEDEGFVFKCTDINGNVLFGVKRDNSFYWLSGVPKAIVDFYKKNGQNTPSMYCSGDGTIESPYSSQNGYAGFDAALAYIDAKGGKVSVKSGQYNISNTIVINRECTNIEGDSWAYPNHPNGVFEGYRGSKIKQTKDGEPIICVSGNTSGISISQLGLFGTTQNGYTVGAYKVDNPEYNSGIFLSGGRIDQILVRKVSCANLAVGILAYDVWGDVDASTFELNNCDGCNIGMMIKPSTTYYTAIVRNILADCPAFGLFVEGGLSMTIDNNVIVRNGGNWSQQQKEYFKKIASCYVSDVRLCKFINNQIHMSGEHKCHVNDGQIVDNAVYYYETSCVGLYFSGDDSIIKGNDIDSAMSNIAEIHGSKLIIESNRFTTYQSGRGNRTIMSVSKTIVSNNRFEADEKYCLEIDGDENAVADNMFTKMIIVRGNNNVVRNNIFDTAEDKYILVDENSLNTKIYGVPASKIIDNGINTVIYE